MIDRSFPSLKKSANDKKHRIYQAIQSIKDAILKRKFNQAWDHAAKYYEQNKTSLSNEQTYQLCWLSCQSITKKTNLRLTASPKSYIPLTESHLQHLFSLYLSLHILILPQVTNKDRQHFDMLSTSQQLINPKFISPHDLVFQRKPGSFFLPKDQIGKCLKKLVKQHLRITNNVLMFKVKNKKSAECVIEAANNAEQIFSSFKEHQFPVEMMNFQLIKLSIMEDLGIREGFKCEYKLPIGLINKIYTHLKGNKEAAVEHYIKKLSSYLVLSFRNLSVFIQDIFIICQQILFMTKMMQEKLLPPSYHTIELRKKLPFLKLNRQLTIQKDHVEQSLMGRSNKSNISGGYSTNNKISQKKLESKTKLYKPEGQLRSVALLALEKINNHLSGRKEVNQIILRYFTEAQFIRLKCSPTDQIIENQVFLQLSRKNRKSNSTEDSSQQISQKFEKKQNKSLTSLLKKKGLQKKLSTFDEEEREALIANIQNKKQGKFILKNINLIKKEVHINANIQKKLQNIANQNLLDNIGLVDQSSSDQEGNLRLSFQNERRRQLKVINDKYSIKVCEKIKKTKLQGPLAQQMELYENQLGINDEQRMRSISLLDDVVSSKVNELLQLPRNERERHGSFSMSNNNAFKKLENLKFQVENLNLERKLLVERLQKRNSTVSLSSFDLSVNFDKKIDEITKKQQNILHFTEKLKEKVSKHIAINSKLMNLEKQNQFKISVQPKIKLKLDKAAKKIPELTFARLQEQYKRLEGLAQDKKQAWDMVLSSQYDKLRRDVAKNQFASQNQKKPNKNAKCQTIRQSVGEEDCM